MDWVALGVIGGWDMVGMVFVRKLNQPQTECNSLRFVYFIMFPGATRQTTFGFDQVGANPTALHVNDSKKIYTAKEMFHLGSIRAPFHA